MALMNILIRPRHPDIVPPVPWESACHRRRSTAAEGAISPENAQAKGPWNQFARFALNSTCRDVPEDNCFDRRIPSLGFNAKRAAETLESGVNSAHRWGKSLRYRGQRGETQEAVLSFHPFFFSRNGFKKSH